LEQICLLVVDAMLARPYLGSQEDDVGDHPMSDNGHDNRTRGERLQIMLTPEELKVVDDFRFNERMPSRAAAVRELFRRGLAAAGMAPAETGRKSSDFGVLESE
jgi:hypothetical protein